VVISQTIFTYADLEFCLQLQVGDYDSGFRLGSMPAVVSLGPDHRDVHVRGQDGAVYHKYWQ
jgi:hypothetical protein